MYRLLIVEDNLTMTQLVAGIFPRPGFETTVARSLSEAYDRVERQKFHLAIVDRTLPDGDGVDFVQELRTRQPAVPVLILSHKNLTQDKIVGLRCGADDYLPKPFATEELQLRVRSLLNKTKHLPTTVLRAGELEVCTTDGEVVYQNRRVRLRKKECEILSFLVEHKNNVVSREQLIDHIWNPEDMPTFKTVDVYMRRIRSLLGVKETPLKTIRGYGYMLEEQTTSQGG